MAGPHVVESQHRHTGLLLIEHSSEQPQNTLFFGAHLHGTPSLISSDVHKLPGVWTVPVCFLTSHTSHFN